MAHHEAMFDHTFDHSPIGMLVADAEGKVVSVNRAFTRLFGHADSALLGKRAEMLTHPEDQARERELSAQLVAGVNPSYQLSKRILHRSGDVIWTRSTVSRVVDTHGTARYIAQVEDVTEARRAKELLSRRTLHDSLTGLPNRALVLDRLASSLDAHRERDTTVACLFLDVDHFKLINDSLGHEAGDTLLVEIARRIQRAVRPGDTVARLGGDEFVVLLEDVPTQESAEIVLAAVSAAVQAPFVVEGHEVVPTMSAGLALAEPRVTADSLLRNADTAMSHAKLSGRNRIEVFSANLRENALVRLSIEAELRTAIRKEELVVHYQPIVDLETRETVALEALVRWDHPTRGLLLPQYFIEISEDTNLVVPLGAYVIHEACRFIAATPEYRGRVLVNVSTRQIGGADLTRVVRSALDATGVDPSRLALEITESGMLLATQDAHADMSALTEMGIDLIIDDFGTGYSALSSVLQNPVAGLKLAREFTLRLGDRSTGDRISTAVATLVDSLHMYGVIEGIETEAQYRQALAHGWKLGQGFLFGYPAPAGEVAREVCAAAPLPAPVG
ncbi:putative bifunctional diguanylate cyclase/phosphodiesterase [Demequina sp. SO4-18]|uniref:putative bifunctional diguanylate cyclase/phosphodiesterase n=1 Tax=Demequina sp. SO4-18 TaxID=3401026 RepID=UPI003B5B720F